MAFDVQEFLGLCGLHIPNDGENGARGVCFASGSNRRQEVHGFASVGIPPGLAATNLLRKKDGSMVMETVLELDRLADSGLPVFLDSGAYGAWVEGSTIDHEGWELRFDLYARLASTLGPQLYVVAPDVIMDQGATMALLERYAAKIQGVAALGAQVLLPMQPGDMGLVSYLGQAIATLGIPVIPAFPMRKISSGPRKGERMTRPADLVAFVMECQPEKVHLLGLGAANADSAEILSSLWAVKPDLYIHQDSTLLRSRVGTKESPRQFDVEMRLSVEVFLDEWAGEGSAFDEKWDYTDSMAFPGEWITPAIGKVVAERAGLSPKDAKAFLANPTEFVQEDVGGVNRLLSDPMLELALDHGWRLFLEETTATRRRAWAISRTFDDHEAAHQFCRAEQVFHEVSGHGVDVGALLAIRSDLCELANSRLAVRFASMERPALPVEPLAQGTHPFLFGPEALEGARASLVIIPCGAKKASQASMARDLYQGSMFVMGMRAAEVLREQSGARVLILSGKHGLLQLDQVIEPYEQRMGEPGSVSVDAIRAQAVAMGLLDAHVVVLAGRDYAGPVLQVWPDAKAPLVGLGGIGFQRQVLSRIIKREVMV